MSDELRNNLPEKAPESPLGAFPENIDQDKRRNRPDRRQSEIPVAYDRRSGKDRRLEALSKGEPERRRMVDPTTCERDYSEDEVSFMIAMDSYKRANRRPFPTWSEVLEVLRALGYRKVEIPTPIPGVPVAVTRSGSEDSNPNL